MIDNGHNIKKLSSVNCLIYLKYFKNRCIFVLPTDLHFAELKHTPFY